MATYVRLSFIYLIWSVFKMKYLFLKIFLPMAMVTSRSELLPRTMSGSVAISIAVRVCVDICASCHHWRLCKCPGSGPPPETMFVSQNHTASRVVLIWLACAATQSHDDTWARASTCLHPWSYCSQVNVDVHGPCCPQSPHWCPGSGLPSWLCWFPRAMLLLWGNPNLRGLCWHPEPWWHLGPCCHQESYLGLWSCFIWDLY